MTVEPEQLGAEVEAVLNRVSQEDVDTYGRLRAIDDRSRQIRVVVEAWENQQNEERELRRTYANWLLVAVLVQLGLSNLFVAAIGFDWLTVPEWVASAFIVSVFAEIAALTLIVVKYLFPLDRLDILRFLRDEAD